MTMRMTERNYREKSCVLCGKRFKPEHPRRKRCQACSRVLCVLCATDISKSASLSRVLKGRKRICIDCYSFCIFNRFRGGVPVAPLGERRKGKQGYVYVKTEQGWELEHRMVMAKTLGRPLKAGEIVHHKDEDRANNDPGNLVLCQGLREHLQTHHAHNLKNPPTHHNGKRRPGDPGYVPIKRADAQE